MKKLLVAVAVLGWSASAIAGDYHKRETLRCSQCHTMHASRQHQLNGAGVDTEYPLAQQGTPHRKLLIQNGTNETCLACHDAKTAFPDVLGANGGSVAADHRSAGALNGTVGSHSAAGFSDWMGHTLGTDAAPPGYVGIYEATPVEGFNCANCHAVHGSRGYRNLGLSSYMGLEGMPFTAANPFTNVGPTYNAVTVGGTRDTTFVATNDVTITAAGRTYETQAVTFGLGATTATTTVGGMNAYCAVCHGNFHGTDNTQDIITGTAFIRHPTTGVTRLGADDSLLQPASGGTAQLAIVRPAWAAAPTLTTDFQAACLTCHKGHGNARGYGLIFPNNTATITDYENGDAVAVDLGDGAGSQYPLRNLCITCHPMGRF